VAANLEASLQGKEKCVLKAVDIVLKQSPASRGG
jgi:hypothetical protein